MPFLKEIEEHENMPKITLNETNPKNWILGILYLL